VVVHGIIVSIVGSAWYYSIVKQVAQFTVLLLTMSKSGIGFSAFTKILTMGMLR